VVWWMTARWPEAEARSGFQPRQHLSQAGRPQLPLHNNSTRRAAELLGPLRRWSWVARSRTGFADPQPSSNSARLARPRVFVFAEGRCPSRSAGRARRLWSDHGGTSIRQRSIRSSRPAQRCTLQRHLAAGVGGGTTGKDRAANPAFHRLSRGPRQSRSGRLDVGAVHWVIVRFSLRLLSGRWQ